MTERVRLGGMALANGVLVHGPRAWACAVRTGDGELKVVARRKGFRAADVRNPALNGLARIAEVFALLPQVKRRGSSRSRLRLSRCAAATSPPTTAPSTSRSAATSTARRARGSTSAAARTCSAR